MPCKIPIVTRPPASAHARTDLYLPIDLSICLSIHVCLYAYIHPSIHPSIHTYTYLRQVHDPLGNNFAPCSTGCSPSPSRQQGRVSTLHHWSLGRFGLRCCGFAVCCSMKHLANCGSWEVIYGASITNSLTCSSVWFLVGNGGE